MTKCVNFSSTASNAAMIFYLVAVLAFAGTALGQPDDACVVEDDGSGTVVLPPEGCSYLSPDEVHMIIDGLPPGTTIELKPIHTGFFCANPPGNAACVVEPGGDLGGMREIFDSTSIFELNGTGDLAGFHRILAIPTQAETHTGPRNPGDPVQAFDTDMFLLQGQLFGDPDFAQLQIVGGTNFELPSPGFTTLTRLGPPGSDFNVDSFFDISYRISFMGAPGGALAGLSGTTEGTVRVEATGERDPCLAADRGDGTVELPPDGCDYLSPEDLHLIIDGLPPGTQIEIAPRHTGFFCESPTGCGEPGGGLGGEVELFDSTLVLQLAGTNALGDFRRTLRIPATVETHTGPRTPGQPVQSFPTEMVNLQGQLFGDPDFAKLAITAGSGNGLPSPGHTILEDRGDGTFLVDSFFDIEYRIDFEGAPGGALDGLSGSTTSLVRVTARNGKTDSVEIDDGTGTVTVPPEGGEYVSPDEVHMIIDGLPPGTTIELDPSHRSFFCDTTPCGQLPPPLQGDDDTLSAEAGDNGAHAKGIPPQVESFQSTLDIELRGTGSLVGFKRTLSIPTSVMTSTGPRNAGDPVQTFDTEMLSILGALPPGDPDFEKLTITAGSDNGMPSPGSTTLTDRGDGSFIIDSFFDIEYQIDFVGAMGGQLEGLSGSTNAQIRVTACDRTNPEAPAHNITIIKESDPKDGTDFFFTGLGDFSLDDDTDGLLPRRRTFNNLNLGEHTVTETVTAGWTLISIECDDPDGGTTVDLAAGEVTIDLDLGEAITCTFKNVLTTNLIFVDGFESGNVSRWSSSSP